MSDWKLANGSFSLSATIPVNTTAEIFMPSAMPVSIDGQAAKLNAAGAVEPGSGTYSLSAALP